MSTPTVKAKLVMDVMLPLNKFPVILDSTLYKLALEEMGHFRLGIACLIDQAGQLSGILTDGDIRRKLLKDQRLLSALFVDDAIEHAIKNPYTITSTDQLSFAVKIMGDYRIWDLPVVDNDNRLVGLLHLHSAISNLLSDLT